MNQTKLNEWFTANWQMIEILGRYNSERAHGLVHTPEWSAQMARTQKLYDDRIRAEITV